MDTTRFQTALSILLMDPAMATFNQNALIEAQNEALRDYSRYVPLVRAYGTGSLYLAVSSGAAAIQTVGGPFPSGSTVMFSPGEIFQDGPYVLSAPTRVSTANLNTGQPVQYIITPVLANSHIAGENVWIWAPSELGLTLVDNQNQYPMPYDFVDPDLASLNVGLGLRSATKELETFYDGVYRNSERISGVGFGASQNFSGLGGLGASDVFYNSQIGLMDSTATDPQGYFFTNTTPAVLNFYTFPTLLGTVQFNYVAEHLPETVPDADIDALLHRAAYAAMVSLSIRLGARLDWKDDDVSEHPSALQTSLMIAAKEAMSVFEDRVKKKPVVYTG